jgi:hypothetical protein
LNDSQFPAVKKEAVIAAHHISSQFGHRPPLVERTCRHRAAIVASSSMNAIDGVMRMPPATPTAKCETRAPSQYRRKGDIESWITIAPQPRWLTCLFQFDFP